ncbi:uncharacterized protein LTR77_010114 [Saxophila tyrrhenica]|uniref:AB hydrolase-1 domain-containing protein n=1 Tax=Saxophila tyrrhenica TaxID=1690608 RepID=A0AAV9NZW8_9PEZI|nr:hypothetical protein LTR77_010114 [Saxophila tyrrhenica]
MPQPTLVLVHGSWHSPEHFGPLIENLQSHGYRCVPVSLPSTQSPDLPPATLADDTAAVRDAVLTELDQENDDVVVVAHSYGGGPTNNALYGLDANSRSATGASAAVRAIVFLCSIPLPKGVSFLTGLGGKPSGIHDLRTGGFAWVGKPGPQHYFYNDLPDEEAKKWSDLLRPQSWPAYVDDTTYAAYMDIHSAYLYCTLDQAFPLQAQQGLVAAAKEAGAKFDYEETLEASHSPFLSKVEETGAFIRRVAGA